MKTSDFYYELPKELIAQYPSARRDESLLMIINRTTGAIAHRRFYDLVDYLQAGDCLVFNDSKVIRARLLGKKQTGAKVETLLIKHIEKNFWQALIKPLKRLKENDIIMIEQDFQVKLLQKKLGRHLCCGAHGAKRHGRTNRALRENSATALYCG